MMYIPLHMFKNQDLTTARHDAVARENKTWHKGGEPETALGANPNSRFDILVFAAILAAGSLAAMPRFLVLGS
jgi:hypothetical protein